jgi:hypothetical protein
MTGKLNDWNESPLRGEHGKSWGQTPTTEEKQKPSRGENIEGKSAKKNWEQTAQANSDLSTTTGKKLIFH